MSRRTEAQRIERLEDMQAQIALGTLVIRQMTISEHEAATHAARSARARTEARREQRRRLTRAER